MKTIVNQLKSTTVANLRWLAFLLAIIFTPSLAQAASGTWSGATDALWTNTLDWSASPAPDTGDTATFNGNGNGNTIIDLTGGVTISNILFDTASAAAYTIGSGSAGAQTLTLGQVNGGITMSATVTSNQVLNANLALPVTGFYNIINNSATNILTLAGTNTTTSTGSTVLTVDGTGTVSITGPIAFGTNAMGLQKTNSGTLLLSGGGFFSATNVNVYLPGAAYQPVDLRAGTTIISSGIYTNLGELTIGGVSATTNGGPGNNVNLTINGGSLGISSWFNLGRGNGTGSVSSDLVLNNSAVVNVGNFSGGYNGTSTTAYNTNAPKGSLTLNNSSTFTVMGNGGLNFAESPGSDFTMTLNNSAQFIALGTAQKHLGMLGKGTVNLNDTSVMSLGNGVVNVGYRNGTGVVNVASSAILRVANDFRVGGSDSSGTGRNAYGTFTSSGTVTVSSLTIARGNNNQNGSAGIVILNGGTFTSTNDVVVGYAGTNLGTMVINGGTLNVGTTVTKWLQFGQWDFTSAEFDMTNGNLNLNTGTSIKFNTQNSSGNHTFNQYGGAVTFYSDFATTVGGTGNLDLQQNASAGTSPVNTYNLNGGTLTVPQVTSSAATCTRIFNFNGGTLRATAPGTSFFNLGSGSATANVRNGGAIIDCNGNDITIVSPLVHSTIAGDAAVDGGLTKSGAGSLTLSGGYTYTGNTVLNGGTLSLNATTVSPGTAGSLTVSNATLALDVSGGASLPASNVTLQNNTALNFKYGALTVNPSVPAINVTGSLSAPGSSINISIDALGMKVGQFRLIKYSTTGPANLANFSLTLPPGVVANLSNNVGNASIDLVVTFAPYFLTWYGSVNTNWDIGTTVNWKDGVLDRVYQQYTNGATIVGDAVQFDDTLTNDFVNPQPTNINLTGTFYPFPVTVDSTLPYSFTGVGGITGPTYLLKTNSGSLTLLTSNSFTGGLSINGGSVIITNDFALGASASVVTLNGGALQVNGNTTNNARGFRMPVTSSIGVITNVTARFGGPVTGAGGLTKIDDGTLTLAGANTYAGNTFVKAGTLVVDSGGVIRNATWNSIGQSGTDNGTLILKGTGSFFTSSDFNVGDIDSAVGTFNIQDSATLTANGIFVASANNAGSTASGTVNQTGGTVTQTNPAAGVFVIGGRNTASSLGVGVYNLSGGTVTASSSVRVGANGTGTVNQYGGLFNAAANGINIARLAGGGGTYNLNGGTLLTLNIASSTGTNAVFNFNGGTLKPAANNPTFFQSLSGAYVRDGGAVIDTTNFNVTIAQPLLQSTNISDVGTGVLTKKGAGTLSLTGADTYTNTTAVSAGTLLVTPAHQVIGAVTVASNAVFGVLVNASGAATVGNLTLGSTSLDMTTLAFSLVTGSNPTSPVLQVGTITLNGTNTVRLSGIVAPGTFPIVKYTGAIAGLGIFNTNVIAPQGQTAALSNSVAGSTLYVTVTGSSSGIVWTGTNSAPALTNVWNLNSAINWLAGGVPAFYQEIIPPGDAVAFNDIGSGLVLLSNTASPASIQISNNAVNYAFRGTGHLSGTAGLTKQGSGTATISLSGNDYTGNTTVSGGTLQLGSTNTLPDGVGTGSLIVNSAGTLNLAGFSETINGLSGSGIIDNSGGAAVLTMGNGNGAVTWPGTIAAGVGGTSIIKVGSGDSIITGTNYLTSTAASQVNGGTMLITNGGALHLSGGAEFWVMQNAGTATVIVDGGTLDVANNWLVVGRNNIAAIGTLIVNSGLVQKAGANNIVVGSLGATGYLYVNGGQVLNNGNLWLGENTGANAYLYLNGGLIQATQVRANGTAPTTSIAYFNGGTLQATASSGSFLQVLSMVMSNGLVLDDNGYTLSIGAAALQDGDGYGGGLLKKGSGTVYLDAANYYHGTTLVTNGTLAGIGSINSPMIVRPAGNLGAGDAGATVGTFTIYNNLTLQGNATLRIDKTGGSPVQDNVTVYDNITYGGILTVTNITSDATPLTTTNTFQLFSVSGSTSGNFTSIVGSPGAGLAYSFTPASGVLSVVTGTTIASNPTNITFSVSGSTLSLSWPADHLGWLLQSQTNSLSTGISTNWFDVPGSASSTSAVINMNPANATVFYRLRHP